MSGSRASRRLARVPGLSTEAQAACKAAGVSTCREFLAHGTLELVDRLDLYLSDVEEATDAVAEAAAPKPRTALQLLQLKADGPRPLRTGLPTLDAHLGGGLRAGSITEVVGPAGMGKTQLCLTLTARALFDTSATGGRVLYVDNERSFQPARLVQLLRLMVSRDAPALEPEELAARVHVVQPATWDEYERCLPSLETELLQEPASLIVVDSVAAPARVAFAGRDRVIQRQDALAAQAAFLKYLAETYQLVALVVNQVMGGKGGASGKNAGDASMAGGGGSGGGELSVVRGAEESELQACLGISWAHHVNTRLVLQHADAAQARELRIAKDPMCSEARFAYAIGPAGLVPPDSIVPDDDASLYLGGAFAFAA